MRTLPIIFLLALPLLAYPQKKHPTTYINPDSLSKPVKDNWLFHEGDSTAFASPYYFDSAWPVTHTELNISNKPKRPSDSFNSIGWFRLHFSVDTNMVMHPMAFKISHPGASEIFLDGKKIASFGLIAPNGGSKNCNPKSTPFIVVLQDRGPHLLAVRYANYDARRIRKIYHRNTAGFTLIIEDAEMSFRKLHLRAVVITFVLTLMFGVFVALSILHLLLYLYYKTAKSNLFFSIFCFSLALIFLLVLLNQYNTNPYIILNNYLIISFAVSSACLSLSGFINELFSKKKQRFKIIAALSYLPSVMVIVNTFGGIVLFTVVIAIVTIESVTLTIKAIYNRVKGARTIGFGVLFFSFFFITIIILIIYNKDFDDSSATAQILELFGFAAIMSLPGSMSVFLAWSFAGINKNLSSQLQKVKVLSDYALEQEQEKKRLLEGRQEELEREVMIRTHQVITQKLELEKQHLELKAEKKKADDLLLNILPSEVAEELKNDGESAAKFYDYVSVLFTDFIDFTIAGERMMPQELVDELHHCFKTFDEISTRYNIEKIKTIGDAYMAVAGLPVPDKEHAVNIVRAAFEIMDFMAERKAKMGSGTFDIRIGIHSGCVVAGIVGVKKFAYDIWGDTVNTAARMEQHSEKGKINVSSVTYELIKGQFACTYRGKIIAKNKGPLKMYFVDREYTTPQ